MKIYPWIAVLLALTLSGCTKPREVKGVRAGTLTPQTVTQKAQGNSSVSSIEETVFVAQRLQRAIEMVLGGNSFSESCWVMSDYQERPWESQFMESEDSLEAESTPGDTIIQFRLLWKRCAHQRGKHQYTIQGAEQVSIIRNELGLLKYIGVATSENFRMKRPRLGAQKRIDRMVVRLIGKGQIPRSGSPILKYDSEWSSEMGVTRSSEGRDHIYASGTFMVQLEFTDEKLVSDFRLYGLEKGLLEVNNKKAGRLKNGKVGILETEYEISHSGTMKFKANCGHPTNEKLDLKISYKGPFDKEPTETPLVGSQKGIQDPAAKYTSAWSKPCE